MGWIVKIFLFTNFLLAKEPTTDIYTYHINLCHFLWAEDFNFQLELKENQSFYFIRKVYDSRFQKTQTAFVSGNYYISNDTLVLTPSATTHKFVTERAPLYFQIKEDKLIFIDKLELTIFPNQFTKSYKPIIPLK